MDDTATKHAPEVVRHGLLDCQVCVPSEFTDEQVVEFANEANPAGTENGWAIRKEGNRYLAGAPERQACNERAGMVHVMLEC